MGDAIPKKEGQKGAPKENEHINVKVLGQDGSSVCFKIKRHTAFKKLMQAYCNRANLSQHAVRFRFDGDPITESDTPLSLSMEDGDAVEVFQEQTGGDCSLLPRAPHPSLSCAAERPRPPCSRHVL